MAGGIIRVSEGVAVAALCGVGNVCGGRGVELDGRTGRGGTMVVVEDQRMLVGGDTRGLNLNWMLDLGRPGAHGDNPGARSAIVRDNGRPRRGHSGPSFTARHIPATLRHNCSVHALWRRDPGRVSPCQCIPSSPAAAVAAHRHTVSVPIRVVQRHSGVYAELRPWRLIICAVVVRVLAWRDVVFPLCLCVPRRRHRNLVWL